MRTLFLTGLLMLTGFEAHAYLAHHWHAPGVMGHQTPVNAALTGIPATNIYLSGTSCIIRDPALNAYDTSTAPNPASAGQSVCRMANQFVVGAGCSINVTTNMYVCSGEVNPASCSITGNQTRCN